jgi:RNA polymerase sigma-70 factor (ECF subfamily)
MGRLIPAVSAVGIRRSVMRQSDAAPVDPLDEAARRVASGDTAAYERIVNATSRSLVRLSARMLGSVADAEDVVQECFVKAYRSITAGKFDGRSSVKTWLYRIVTHASIDALRTRSRRPLADDPVHTSFGGAEVAEARVALVELSTWLDALPPDQRAALVLKAVEGFTTSEIAEILVTSEGAVEQRLVRARATLRDKRSAS